LMQHNFDSIPSSAEFIDQVADISCLRPSVFCTLMVVDISAYLAIPVRLRIFSARLL